MTRRLNIKDLELTKEERAALTRYESESKYQAKASERKLQGIQAGARMAPGPEAYRPSTTFSETFNRQMERGTSTKLATLDRNVHGMFPDLHKDINRAMWDPAYGEDFDKVFEAVKKSALKDTIEQRRYEDTLDRAFVKRQLRERLRKGDSVEVTELSALLQKRSQERQEHVSKMRKYHADYVKLRAKHAGELQTQLTKVESDLIRLRLKFDDLQYDSTRKRRLKELNKIESQEYREAVLMYELRTQQYAEIQKKLSSALTSDQYKKEMRAMLKSHGLEIKKLERQLSGKKFRAASNVNQPNRFIRTPEEKHARELKKAKSKIHKHNLERRKAMFTRGTKFMAATGDFGGMSELRKRYYFSGKHGGAGTTRSSAVSNIGVIESVRLPSNILAPAIPIPSGVSIKGVMPEGTRLFSISKGRKTARVTTNYKYQEVISRDGTGRMSLELLYKDKSEAVKAYLKRLHGTGCQVGWFNAKDAEKAHANNFGTVKMGEFGSPIFIPARPFIDHALKNFTITKARKTIAHTKTLAGLGAIQLIPESIAADIQLQIRLNILRADDAYTPNAPYTIRKKGFNQPLVETGQMLDSLNIKLIGTNEQMYRLNTAVLDQAISRKKNFVQNLTPSIGKGVFKQFTKVTQTMNPFTGEIETTKKEFKTRSKFKESKISADIVVKRRPTNIITAGGW